MRKQLEIIAWGIPEADRQIDAVNALSRFAKHWLRNPKSIRKGEVTANTIPQEVTAERDKSELVPLVLGCGEHVGHSDTTPGAAKPAGPVVGYGEGTS